MKKILIALVLLVAAYLLYHFSRTPSTLPTPVVVSVPLAESRPYCFVYKHAATDDAPYVVEEHMTLSRVRGDITGTKRGTQAGPDMTNGYEGTLTGSAKAEGSLEMVYAYTVEGSNGKELELYTIQGNDVVQERYPLIEGKHDGVSMLIPDQTKPAEPMTYIQEACPL